MAELSDLSRASERSDRGQLILVTGFVLAFTLVAIVLLLNTTIYTENIASRGIDRSPEEAVEFREAASEGVGDLIVEVNDDESLGESAFLAAIENMSILMEREFANRGTIALIESKSGSPTDGVEIWQTNFTTFANASIPPASAPRNWTVGSNIQAARGVSLNVSNTSLFSTPNPDQAGTFRIKLEDGSGNTWTAFIYDNGGDVHITTRLNGADQVTCSGSGSTVWINISEGYIGGEPCSGLEWAKGLDSPYDIEFLNPDNVQGTYNMTFRGGTVNGGINFDTGPYHRSIIYSATIRVYYQTSTLTYETNVTVAPEAS